MYIYICVYTYSTSYIYISYYQIYIYIHYIYILTGSAFYAFHLQCFLFPTVNFSAPQIFVPGAIFWLAKMPGIGGSCIGLQYILGGSSQDLFQWFIFA